MAAKCLVCERIRYTKDEIRASVIDRMSVADYDRAIADGYTPWEAASIADESIDPDMLSSENCITS
jgi:hypothetical protein